MTFWGGVFIGLWIVSFVIIAWYINEDDIRRH